MRNLEIEKGFVMPTVLIAMLVVGLLATALWHYGNSEMRQAELEEKRTNAFYIARAGAESVGRYIMANPAVLNSIPDVDDYMSSADLDFEVNYFGETVHVGTLNVLIKRIEQERVKITGTGNVDDIIQDVSMIIKKDEGLDVNAVVYSTGSMEFHGSAMVTGNLISGGSIVPPIGFTGIIRKNVELVFPPPDPDFPPVPGTEGRPGYSDNLTVGSSPIVTISSSPAVFYYLIAINKGGSLVINAASNAVTVETRLLVMHNNAEQFEFVTKEGKHIVLIVDEMTMRRVTVSGDGIAFIYVRSRLNVQTPHADFNVGPSATLAVYLGPGAIMDVRANAYFEGLVYGPEGIVEMAGNADFNGRMIVQQLKGKGANIGSSDTNVTRDFSWNVIGLKYGRPYSIEYFVD
ncbi:MAG TPA: hypothetical protein VLH18_03670 [Candidatus Limnocylindrales bacterium]|nr:hypothetical protein [Candidatus Limnocylindrales bacterium]